MMMFGDQTYAITAVGNEVNTNLDNLGHTCDCFDGATTPELAGSPYLEQKAPIRIWMSATVIKVRRRGISDVH